ncbi:prepilin-type N-terminal cleavage/methylation domain-containing protein [Paludicola sp. MB14-C6]|uniref:PulJ/GspJ family protein n=1 Tax=Paludihabitans sp. MB14-C6 TaxID=3070656 RepID=UPI0027DAF86F|nr:prepilin-type N-terminal cleavage/methylation domain-containing protein [Paludicola sp. MB14-C6]WMJ22101.1 prepilin-type N-terminal cleavage/methylation domain-containing protein [Paludicola sp. MB14-C6]
MKYNYRCKKGFTLVEVVVTSAISSIILIGALSVVMITLNTVAFNSNVANAKNISCQLVEFITNKVKYANSLVIKSGNYTNLASPTPNNVIYQQYDLVDSSLLRTMIIESGETMGDDILKKEFFDELTFIITYSETTQTDVLQMNIVVRKKSNLDLVYSTTSMIKTYNACISDATGHKEGNYIEFDG